MSIRKNFVGLNAALALIAGPVSQATAEDGAKTHHRHFAKRSLDCPVHRTADGELADCQGWRLRPGIGWDNSCFNLDYLPSQFACSGKGHRRLRGGFAALPAKSGNKSSVV